MKITQTIGRILLITFFITRIKTHLEATGTWEATFVPKYSKYYEIISKHEIVSNNVDSKWLSYIEPTSISKYVTYFDKYLAYTEIAVVITLILEVPLLSFIGSTLLFVEAIFFFDPYSQFYELVITLGVMGIITMMAFTPDFNKSQQKRRSPEPVRPKMPKSRS